MVAVLGTVILLSKFSFPPANQKIHHPSFFYRILILPPVSIFNFKTSYYLFLCFLLYPSNPLTQLLTLHILQVLLQVVRFCSFILQGNPLNTIFLFLTFPSTPLFFSYFLAFILHLLLAFGQTELRPSFHFLTIESFSVNINCR